MTESRPDTSADSDPGLGARSQVARRRTASAVHEVCPFLRADSASWRSAYASRDHRCGAVRPAAQLTIAKQRSLCLLPEHDTCATYLAARSVEPDAPSTAEPDLRTDLWPETRSTPVILEPTRGLFPPVTAGPTRAGGQALLVGLMVLAFVLLVIARTAPPPGGASSPGASASAGIAASLGTSPTPAAPTGAPSSAPTPTAGPPATPQASPSVGPAPSPTPVPGDARRYTVQAGDTLTGIAAKFGTTVKAITTANNITNARLIRPGQVLIIP